MAFCQQCGTQNPDGSRFCTGCGADLTAQAAPQQAAPVNPNMGGSRHIVSSQLTVRHHRLSHSHIIIMDCKQLFLKTHFYAFQRIVNLIAILEQQ